uniref:60S acidic ribosomal protein P2 n=1 Tax=Timspurckia oligopyrenoides TaxID=708627 RepID=A0A7S0ZFH2_9RHOD
MVRSGRNREDLLQKKVADSIESCTMKYVAAYMLVALSGKESPSSSDVEKVLSAAGVEIDEAALKKVCDELSGKNLEEVIAAGEEKFSAVPVGATGGAPAAAGGAAETAAAAAPEPEPEEEEEEAEFDLFD